MYVQDKYQYIPKTNTYQKLQKYYNDNSSGQYVTQASTCLRMQIILPVACFARGEIIVTNTSLLLTGNRLAPEMVEDLVMLKCNLRLLRSMSTV